MNTPEKPPTRKLGTTSLLIAAAVVCLIILYAWEAGSRAALSRDISMFHQADSVIRLYSSERGHYPPSLDDPDLQRHFDEHLVAFLREGRITYHPPAADSPPTFILLDLTTPRGDCSSQLDGNRIYPRFK